MARGDVKRAQRAASQRAHYLENCLRKIPFASPEAARAAARRVDESLQVYRCPFGRGTEAHWHYGNRVDTPAWKRRDGIEKDRPREMNWMRRLQQRWHGSIARAATEENDDDRP